MKNENMKEAIKLLSRFEVIPLAYPLSRKAAEISAKLLAKGDLIDYRDAMMAGIAIENDLKLVTRSKPHFGRIRNLKQETS